MDIKFERVFERDLDLLLINLFSRNSAACQLFYDKINLCPDEITTIRHSVKTAFGESDLEVWFTAGGKTYALLIEDKINASAQPNQHQRYEQRREEYCKQGLTEGFVFLVAPNEYISSNGEASYYDRTVGFDELIPVLQKEKDLFGQKVLECGKQKNNDSKTPDEMVSDFWKQYFDYFRARGKLGLIDDVESRGATSIWPAFRTSLPGTVIKHKSVVNSENCGWVDLEFTGKAINKPELDELLAPYMDDDMYPGVKGKSYNIGIRLEPMYFSKPFSDYTEQMEKVYEAVARLQSLADRVVKDRIRLP